MVNKRGPRNTCTNSKRTWPRSFQIIRKRDCASKLTDNHFLTKIQIILIGVWRVQCSIRNSTSTIKGFNNITECIHCRFTNSDHTILFDAVWDTVSVNHLLGTLNFCYGIQGYLWVGKLKNRLPARQEPGMCRLQSDGPMMKDGIFIF